MYSTFIEKRKIPKQRGKRNPSITSEKMEKFHNGKTHENEHYSHREKIFHERGKLTRRNSNYSAKEVKILKERELENEHDACRETREVYKGVRDTLNPQRYTQCS